MLQQNQQQHLHLVLLRLYHQEHNRLFSLPSNEIIDLFCFQMQVLVLCGKKNIFYFLPEPPLGNETVADQISAEPPLGN